MKLLAPLVLLLAPAAAAPAAFDLRDWVVEQMPGGSVKVRDDTLVIEDAGGTTVWWRAALTAPVEITYEVTAIDRGGPHDRISDVNCFWMANDPQAPDACPFGPGRGRSGKFSDYDPLRVYYVGMGGNNNSTTRFRRYDGSGARPLRPEHDRTEPTVLLQGNCTYRIRIVARDGQADFWRDDERLFTFTDPSPLTRGWFAFRTVRSHLEIRNFAVKPLAK